MSLENEGQHIMDQPAEMNYESQKKLKITYTRDFLLSLSEWDVCKKLPSGFDKSRLSELEDAPQDRQKISGNLSLHSYRRNEYGSSPPTRGDLGNYSRGIHGRWDSHSSGCSDSQSDWDSESGRRYGNQSRRSWQGPEHDGLLGSGSFARPSGYAAGASAPKFHANDHYQLNKSNEPYHPPRPYKAVPHTRRETNDSFNDETFGSSECTSEDRAEEERKRRASFELMRKEQHKAFQEKQRLNSDKHKDEFEISTFLEDVKDIDGISSKSKQFDNPVILPATNKDSDKSTLPSQTPASRPLVPPGFTSAPSERNIGTKTTTHSHSLEVGNSELEGGILHAKGNRLLNGMAFGNQEKESAEQVGLNRQLERNNHILANKRSHEVQNLSSDLEVSNKTVIHDSELYKNSNLLKSFEASKKSEGVELDAEKVTDNKTVGESNQEKSSLILDKLFGYVSTGSGDGSNSLVEQPNSKADDTWSPHAVHSSKFAHWFLEEDKNPVDELSSDRPNDLLSLIVGVEKGGSQPSDVKATGQISFDFPSQSPEITDSYLASNATSVTLENSEQLSDIIISNPAAVPAVLTCEDLELSILSEISGSDDILRPPVQDVSVTDAKTEQTKANIDDHASHHLLSLLQKGTGLEDIQSPSLDIIASGKPRIVEVSSIQSAVHDPRETNVENVTNSRKSLTLETLFGTAFMKELQSVGAPSSAQKSSIGPDRVDTLELHDGLLSSNLETGSGRMSFESSILASNQPEQVKSDRIKEHLLGFDDRRTELDSSQFQNELESKCGGFDRSADVRLPEEDSLIALSDPMKQLRNSPKTKLFSSQAAPVDITKKVAGLNSASGDERPVAGHPEDLAFLSGSFGVREHDLSFHNLRVQPSSPQLHPSQLNHVGPLFNPLDSHPTSINSPMKFVGPESITHRDPPPAHQSPANMLRPPFHHRSSGLAGFEPPTYHPMVQQMHMQGNFPPPHLLRGFPGALNSNNQMAGFIQDVKPMPGFPFGHQQPNFNGLPIPPPAPEVESGNNNPEMLQRLIEMELRSSTKQIHPLATAGRNQEMHNFQLDTGFGY